MFGHRSIFNIDVSFIMIKFGTKKQISWIILTGKIFLLDM